MDVEARNVPSPAPCPGASRRIRIEEWTYDLNTGKCVKFRTVDKTVSSSKLRRKFQKTWKKATSRFRNSVEDFGNFSRKLRMGSALPNSNPVESSCEENESDATENDDIQREKTVDGTESPSVTKIASMEKEDQAEEPPVNDGKESENDLWYSLSCNDLQTPAAENVADPQVGKDGDLPKSPASLSQSLDKKSEYEKDETSESNDKEGNQCIPLPFRMQEDNMENVSRPPSVTPSIATKTSQLSLSQAACEEACFDLSGTSLNWCTIERMIHKTNIFSFKLHYSLEDDINPEAVTVVGTSESISQLREFLECGDHQICGNSTNSLQSVSHDNTHSPSTAMGEQAGRTRDLAKEEGSRNSTSLSLLNVSLTDEDAHDLQRLIPRTLEEGHESHWENITEDEMLKITSAFNIIASKLAEKKIMAKRVAKAEEKVTEPQGPCSFEVTEENKHPDSNYDVPTNSAENHDDILDSYSDSPEFFAEKVGTRVDEEVGHHGIVVKSASDICTSLTSSDLMDRELKFENLLLDSGVEVSVGDGLSSSVYADDTFPDATKNFLNSAEKHFSNSIEKDFLSSTQNNLTAHIINLDNICPLVEPQETYVCTCIPSKDSSRSNDLNMTNTDSSPAHSIEAVVEEPKNSRRKLEYFVSHSGPFPSRFEIKFEEDIDCEIARCLDQWRIHFGEKASSQDGMLYTPLTTNPNAPEISTGYRKLFSSSGRHFEFSFSERETNNLRVSSNVQDQPQHKQRRSVQKLATTI